MNFGNFGEFLVWPTPPRFFEPKRYRGFLDIFIVRSFLD